MIKLSYNVSELRSKLEEKLDGLGVSPKFKANPAYAELLSEIDGLISQMNMFESANDVMVTEESHVVSFDWNARDGRKYSMKVSCINPEMVTCTRIEDESTHIGNDGKSFGVKNVVEDVATIDKFGFVTLRTNGAIVDNIGCGNNWCNNSTWSEKKYYTSDGVMRDREVKHFRRSDLMQSFDRANIHSILYVPRQAFDGGMFSDSYVSRTLLVRDKLDTARVVSEDKDKGFHYLATNLLNQEHGLKNMSLYGGGLPQDVVISPLSKEEVEEMIERESDPKVREGLRKYAAGREDYHYDSAEDKNFVYDYDDAAKTRGFRK